MLRQVRNFVKEHEMLKPGDRVIAAVSGGADSVCLLSVLTELSPGLPVFLRVVHVHHGLRGAEADRDEACVESLCRQLEIPFETVHKDVASYAAAKKLSTEEAGRILRYEALEAAAAAWDEQMKDEQMGDGEAERTGRAKIAVAHHQEDNAETILHHLLRGSGLRGLSGISPAQGRIIRPLLCVSREEILDYLKERRLEWCEDSTNVSCDYTRNRIRSQLLPMMTTSVNVRAVENILRAGSIFGQADRYLEQQAKQVWQQAGCTGAGPECSGSGADGAGIKLALFLEQPEIIQSYLIRHMFDITVPGWKDITYRHFTQVAELAGRQVGSRADLPCGMMAEVGYDTLWIGRKTQMQQREAEENLKIDGEILKMSIFSREKGTEIPKNQYTKWFDYDKIKDTLSVRYRQKGDYITLPTGGRKTLKAFFVDEKIPRQQREEIPLLAEGSHVLWIAGLRISEYYKITEHTEMVLRVQLDGGTNGG